MTEGEKQAFELFGSIFVGVLITGAIALGGYLDELPRKKEVVKQSVVIEKTESQQVFDKQFKQRSSFKEIFIKEFKKMTKPISEIFFQKS